MDDDPGCVVMLASAVSSKMLQAMAQVCALAACANRSSDAKVLLGCHGCSMLDCMHGFMSTCVICSVHLCISFC